MTGEQSLPFAKEFTKMTVKGSTGGDASAHQPCRAQEKREAIEENFIIGRPRYVVLKRRWEGSIIISHATQR